MTVKWSASSIKSHNAQIRQHTIHLRKQLSQECLLTHSQGLFLKLQSLNLTLKNKKVASYLAVNGEIDNQLLHQYILAQQQAIYLPIIKNETLVFGAYYNDTPLTPNQFKILEPNVAQTENIENMDIVFIPLTAFKKDANRLGMGGGYYDKTIANIKSSKQPLLIGIAHELQHNEQFITQPWDIQMDMIITEKQIYRKKSA